MKIVIDTSAVIAVIAGESLREEIIDITKGSDLIAPASLHWEIGNSFSAMLKRKRINLNEAKAAIESYRKIPLQLIDISLSEAIEWSKKFNIYAYDSFMLVCTHRHRSKLLTLDQGLMHAAKRAKVNILEV